LGIEVHRGANVGVAQQFLLNLYVYLEGTQHGRVAVATMYPKT
jgi:hypothetical protein